jgi:ComF family protein
MVQPGESLCGKCQSSLPAFECVYSPFHYDPPVSNLILQLKFGHKLYVARALGMLLADYLSHALHHQPNLIIPVPMHPSRMGRRGFNQALELARPVQQALDAPIAATLVHRIKLTPPQVGLNATQRQHNVRGAFALHKPLQGAPAVLVIDDVMTTGATANSLARTLLRQGASRVSIATIARARDSH